MVCKQAALLRTPYRNSSCVTNQLKQHNQKESSESKTTEVSQFNNKIKRIVCQKPSPLTKKKPLSHTAN
ncbi:unnamed protein product [Adineta ricciae]|uniref:Uncharacterized protein n=1 Tax=Adineta ricciae TaxID=249248 RepID=A0A815UY95_ADIRI|nr:unnamed protein product [Adineta ricciae]